jgi:hypothetical protein
LGNLAPVAWEQSFLIFHHFSRASAAKINVIESCFSQLTEQYIDKTSKNSDLWEAEIVRSREK